MRGALCLVLNVLCNEINNDFSSYTLNGAFYVTSLSTCHNLIVT